MNGFTKFFTFIFKKGEKSKLANDAARIISSELKNDVLEYMVALSRNSSGDLVKDVVAHYADRIYKKNGKYCKDGEALHQYIVQTNNTIDEMRRCSGKFYVSVGDEYVDVDEYLQENA